MDHSTHTQVFFKHLNNSYDSYGPLRGFFFTYHCVILSDKSTQQAFLVWMLLSCLDASYLVTLWQAKLGQRS